MSMTDPFDLILTNVIVPSIGFSFKMAKYYITTFILHSLLVQSHEFRIKKNINKRNDYYEVQFQNNLDLKPISGFVDNTDIKDFSDRYVYEVALPNENDQNYGVLIEKTDDNLKDLVIIKSKERIVDLGPYTLIRQLDKIKYMVLWLNVYCSVHPDCDKTKMNEELRKMVSTVALQKVDNII